MVKMSIPHVVKFFIILTWKHLERHRPIIKWKWQTSVKWTLQLVPTCTTLLYNSNTIVESIGLCNWLILHINTKR